MTKPQVAGGLAAIGVTTGFALFHNPLVVIVFGASWTFLTNLVYTLLTGRKS